VQLLQSSSIMESAVELR